MKSDDLKWYAVDFDGTLMQSGPNFGYGDPIPENIAKLEKVVAKGYKVIIHTARHWEQYKNIEAWLDRYQVPYKAIVCGKLLAHRYVDDKAIPAGKSTWL